MRIAVLEDDPGQRALLMHWFTDAAHDAHGFTSGRQIMRNAGRENFDLFVLDWEGPDGSGPDVLKWIRAKVSRTVPIMFVTARDSEDDVVFALTHGADDYMVKPVRRNELLARINALLRRSYPELDADLRFPPYAIDIKHGELRHDEKVLDLTPKEFDLAVALFRNFGRQMSREHLQEIVWGKTGATNTRTVDTHINQLRKKLDLGARNGFRITSIRSFGYRLEKIARR